MPRFLFQPDSIDGYEFNPIPIDIHLGIIKIPTEEILDDDAINNTESIIVGVEEMRYQIDCKQRLVENFKGMVNSESQIFDLWLMKQNKHGQELENILKICQIDR